MDLEARVRFIGIIGAIGVMLIAGLASAGNECEVVQGGLHADLYSLPDCQRGVFMCANVTLTGDLAPHSDFTFTSLGKGNVSDPLAFTYAGNAQISASRGHMSTDDSGRFEFSVTGPSPFHTVGTILGGDGIYAGASGVIQVTGLLDFQAQTGDGTYVGVVCVPA
ncbi:MAG: hypothetical protein ACYDCK_00300 [Thermoplasmatota archaeon]